MKALILITGGIRFLMLIASITCVYFGLRNYKNTKHLRGFLVLSILSSIDTISYVYVAIIRLNKNSFSTLSEYTQIIYLVIEIYVIINFLTRATLKDNNISYKYSFLIFLLPFTLILINYLYFDINFLIVMIELVVINFFSIKFFLNQYKTTCVSRNRNRYLISGLFIFINITAPYHIIQSRIETNAPFIMNYINFINDLGYVILFSSIIKEIKWETKK